MRTTIELPDAIFRRLKAKAAMGGIAMKELFHHAAVQILDAAPAPPKKKRKHRVKLPLIKGTPGRAIRPLTAEQMDQLMFG